MSDNVHKNIQGILLKYAQSASKRPAIEQLFQLLDNSPPAHHSLVQKIILHMLESEHDWISIKRYLRRWKHEFEQQFIKRMRRRVDQDESVAYGVLDEEIDRLADKYWQRVSPKKSDNFYDIYEAKKQTATVENSLSQSNKEATNKQSKSQTQLNQGPKRSSPIKHDCSKHDAPKRERIPPPMSKLLRATLYKPRKTISEDSLEQDVKKDENKHSNSVMKQMKKYLKTEQTVKPEDEPVHTDSQRGNALLRSKEKKAEEVRDKSDRKQKLEHQTSQGQLRRNPFAQSLRKYPEDKYPQLPNEIKRKAMISSRKQPLPQPRVLHIKREQHIVPPNFNDYSFTEGASDNLETATPNRTKAVADHTALSFGRQPFEDDIMRFPTDDSEMSFEEFQAFNRQNPKQFQITMGSTLKQRSAIKVNPQSSNELFNQIEKFMLTNALPFHPYYKQLHDKFGVSGYKLLQLALQ